MSPRGLSRWHHLWTLPKDGNAVRGLVGNAVPACRPLLAGADCTGCLMLAASMHAVPCQIVVQVGDIHPHDPGSLPFQPNIHRIAFGHGGELVEGFFLGHTLADSVLHIALP